MSYCVDFCAILTILFALVTTAEGEYYNVSTNNVTFIGFTNNAIFNTTQRDVLIFLGIPYAEPPVGELRFSKPVMKQHINTTYNATYDRPACLQIRGLLFSNTTVLSEDCLYLNIFVPGDRLTNPMKNYSVMVWIHGGSFMDGSMHFYQGDVLSAFNDVIVVTMNYRLSVLGFLSTGYDASMGNYGLYDQQMALQWVHDNIAAFGGDSNSVTLFGESAGAISCFAHALYPANKGLFQRVLLQSSPSYSGTMMPNIEEFGNFAGCNETLFIHIIHCLRNLTQERILEIMTDKRDKIMVGPIVDGKIFTAPLVHDALKNLSSEQVRHFVDLDFLVGYNDKDGTIFVDFWKNIAANNASVANYSVNRTAFENTVVPDTLFSMYGLNNSFLSKALVQQYTDWNDPFNDYERRASLMNFLTDIHFTYPAIFMADVHSKSNSSSNTYLYEFAYRPEYDILNPKWLAGASHGIEIPIVFGLSSRMRTYLKNYFLFPNTPNDTEISKIVITLWTNFAKTGNPNQPVNLTFEWKQYEPNARDYLQFTREMASSSVRMYPGEPQMSFYFEVLPSLLEAAKRIETMTSPAPCPTIQNCLTPAPCPTQNNLGERFKVDIMAMENILIALIVASSALLVGIVFTCIYMCRRRQFGFNVI